MRLWIYQNNNLLKYHQYTKRSISKNNYQIIYLLKTISKLVAFNLAFYSIFHEWFVHLSDFLIKVANVENDIS